MKKQSSFTFIPAPKLVELFDSYNLKVITFFGCSGNYMEFLGVKYITWDGCHVATKVGNRTTWNNNANINLPKGFKAAVKQFC